MASGFEWSLGTLLIGIFINTYLFGVVSYQFGVYFTTKFDDPLWIKTTVVFLCVMDIFYSIAMLYFAWHYCITNFTNPAILTVELWPFAFTPIGTAFAAVLTQNFLGFRIYRLTKNRYIYGTIVFFALVSFALGVASGARAWMIGVTSKFVDLEPLGALWLSLQTALDLTIAGLLAYLLYCARNGLLATDTMLKRLIRGSIQTGLFVAVFAMGDLVSCVLSTSNLYGMFAIPLGRIYTTTLMDTLIVRRDLRDSFREPIIIDAARINHVQGFQISGAGRHHVKPGLLVPTISVQTEIHRDSTFRPAPLRA